MTNSSPMKKFLKQVGNIVAVQAVAGAVTELGKKYMPGIKSRLNAVLDKADELNRAKNSNKELNDIVKNTAEHLKEGKLQRPVPADGANTKPAPTDPPAESPPKP